MGIIKHSVPAFIVIILLIKNIPIFYLPSVTKKYPLFCKFINIVHILFYFSNDIVYGTTVIL